MRKIIGALIVVIALSAISVIGYHGGKYIGSISGNQTDIGMHIYTNGFISGNHTGHIDGNDYGSRSGWYDGFHERIKYVMESTAGRIRWR